MVCQLLFSVSDKSLKYPALVLQGGAAIDLPTGHCSNEIPLKPNGVKTKRLLEGRWH